MENSSHHENGSHCSNFVMIDSEINENLSELSPTVREDKKQIFNFKAKKRL